MAANPNVPETPPTPQFDMVQMRTELRENNYIIAGGETAVYLAYRQRGADIATAAEEAGFKRNLSMQEGIPKLREHLGKLDKEGKRNMLSFLNTYTTQQKEYTKLRNSGKNHSDALKIVAGNFEKEIAKNPAAKSGLTGFMKDLATTKNSTLHDFLMSDSTGLIGTLCACSGIPAVADFAVNYLGQPLGNHALESSKELLSAEALLLGKGVTPIWAKNSVVPFARSAQPAGKK